MSHVICAEKRAWCECVLPVDHEGAHECDAGCGGSWDYDADGAFLVVRLPSSVPGAGR